VEIVLGHSLTRAACLPSCGHGRLRLGRLAARPACLRRADRELAFLLGAAMGTLAFGAVLELSGARWADGLNSLASP